MSSEIGGKYICVCIDFFVTPGGACLSISVMRFIHPLASLLALALSPNASSLKFLNA